MENNNNPLSPHLQVYRWHISSLLSITHRIVGIINFLSIIIILFLLILIGTDKNFFEIYYKEQEKIEFDQLYLKTEVSLLNFLESDRYEWIKESAISEIDDWIIEPMGFGESRLDGLKLYCKVDFMFPSGEKIIILHW